MFFAVNRLLVSIQSMFFFTIGAQLHYPQNKFYSWIFPVIRTHIQEGMKKRPSHSDEVNCKRKVTTGRKHQGTVFKKNVFYILTPRFLLNTTVLNIGMSYHRHTQTLCVSRMRFVVNATCLSQLLHIGQPLGETDPGVCLVQLLVHDGWNWWYWVFKTASILTD